MFLGSCDKVGERETNGDTSSSDAGHMLSMYEVLCSIVNTHVCAYTHTTTHTYNTFTHYIYTHIIYIPFTYTQTIYKHTKYTNICHMNTHTTYTHMQDRQAKRHAS